MKTNFINITYCAVVLMTGYACTNEVLPEVETCITPPALNLLSESDASCSQNTGNIEVAGSGGAGEYEYSIDGNTFQPEGIFSALAAGTYTITVRDANGCTNTVEAQVQNLNGLNISVLASEAGCNAAEGSITINTAGGEAPFQFRLDNGSFQTNNVFESLATGTYTITAKDATNCTVTQEVEVTAGVEFSAIQNIINTNCAVSGCHAGNVSPDLRNAANIQGKAGIIQARTGNKTMPPASSSFKLNDAEIAAINCWVEDGAPTENK
jgi:hypothetical protein